MVDGDGRWWSGDISVSIEIIRNIRYSTYGRNKPQAEQNNRGTRETTPNLFFNLFGSNYRNRYITTLPTTITIYHSPSSCPSSCPSAPALPYPALRPSLPSYPALPPPSPPGGLGFLRELLIGAKSTKMGGSGVISDRCFSF